MLIIFGGLPGSGKSTIAQALAMHMSACWLRLDTIEDAIRSSVPLAKGQDVGPAGYVALYRLAADNLRLGQTVITDSVNPIKITRDAFRDVADETGREFIEVEVYCSDAATHQHRLRPGDQSKKIRPCPRGRRYRDASSNHGTLICGWIRSAYRSRIASRRLLDIYN